MRMSPNVMSVEDARILESEGARVPSGRLARTAEWAYVMGGTDRLIDLLARDLFTARVHLIPADESPVSGRLAAQLCRTAARRSVDRARVLTAEWEALADEYTTAALPAVRWQAGTYQAQRFADSVNALPRPTAAQIVYASCDPQGFHRWSQVLERKGSDILKAANMPATRPDVLPRHRFRFVAMPDSVAFRGTARYQLPQPCQYGQNGHQKATEAGLRAMFAVSSNGTAARIQRAVTEYLTTDTTAHDGPTNERHGWRGHRRIVWSVAPQSTNGPRTARRAAKRAAVGTTATRGPAVGPWALSARSLPAAANRVADVWQALEAACRLAAVGSVVTFSDGTALTMLSPAQVGDDVRGRAFPVREWARRAALAGITV